jgi:hypothetical protein
VIAVLRLPGVLPLFTASSVARLPMGALGLLLVLHTQSLTGSYASGGAVAGVYSLALGVSNPALARLVDRGWQTTVLCAGGLTSAAAVVTLAALPAGASLHWLAGCALLAGAAQPPVGACMRALWPRLVPDADAMHVAFAMEGVAGEIIYICGPLAIVGGIGSWSLHAALVVCAAFTVTGDLVFSLLAAARRWRPEGTAPRHLLGALRGRGVRVLVAVFALCGLAVGAVEVAVPAALDAMGERRLTGVLLGLWGVGSLLAGVAVARGGAPADPPRALALLLALWGAAHAALALAGGPATLAALLVVAGAAIAPTFVCANGMLDGLAPPGTLTEAFTWMSTGMIVGVSIGAVLAGALVEAASASAALAALGGGGVLAGLIVRATAQGALRARVPASA